MVALVELRVLVDQLWQLQLQQQVLVVRLILLLLLLVLALETLVLLILISMNLLVEVLVEPFWELVVLALIHFSFMQLQFLVVQIFKQVLITQH